MVRRFDVQIDDKGRVLMPRSVVDSVRGKKLVMVFDTSEIRIMPQAMFKNLEGI